jgi:hypothetical protein
MLVHIAQLLHLPPLIAYVIALAALCSGRRSFSSLFSIASFAVLPAECRAPALAQTAQEVTRLLQLAWTEEPQVALTSEFTDPSCSVH